MTLPYPLDIPPAVARAYAQAEAIGFGADGGVSSCLPGVGRLLAVWAAGHPGGHMAEIGTGVGAGAAWLASGMDVGSTLVTVELDPERAALAARVLGDDARVQVLTGSWRDHLPALAPFALVFVDGVYEEELRQDDGVRDALVDLVKVGGQLVLDDLSLQPGPNDVGPGTLVDGKRELALRHPRLVGAEWYVPDVGGAVGGTRTGGLVMTRIA